MRLAKDVGAFMFVLSVKDIDGVTHFEEAFVLTAADVL